MSEQLSLKERWFPVKGQALTRPEAVRGSVRADKHRTGRFAVRWTFKYGRLSYRVIGFGWDGLEALDAACVVAEGLFTTALGNPVDA